jgi:AbrB family looped-hinge helix DNA binding protein
MTELVATISSKNQVTLPADVRRHLGVRAADKIAFVVDDGGRVELRPVRYTLESIIGSIEALPNESLDLDREIEAAVEEETVRVLNRQRRA